MPFVLDCSVALTWLLPDESSARTDALCDSLVREPALVPSIWPLEVASVLLTAARRNRISEQELWQLLAHAAALPVLVQVADPSMVFTTVSRFAFDHGLSLYDALYLDLAKRNTAPLATLDARLRQAADREGVSVLPA